MFGSAFLHPARSVYVSRALFSFSRCTAFDFWFTPWLVQTWCMCRGGFTWTCWASTQSGYSSSVERSRCDDCWPTGSASRPSRSTCGTPTISAARSTAGRWTYDDAASSINTSSYLPATGWHSKPGPFASSNNNLLPGAAKKWYHENYSPFSRQSLGISVWNFPSGCRENSERF